MNARQLIARFGLSAAAGLVLVPSLGACNSGTGDNAPAASAKAAGNSGATPASAATTSKAGSEDDPLADYAQIAASCDTSKKLGECIEYKEIGLLGDSLKEMCTSMGGTYSTTARCPAEGRVAVCSVTEGGSKRFWYKSYFEMIKPDAAAASCKDIMLGTYKEYPKAGKTVPKATAKK